MIKRIEKVACFALNPKSLFISNVLVVFILFRICMTRRRAYVWIMGGGNDAILRNLKTGNSQFILHK